MIGGPAALAAALRRRPRLAFAVAWACYLALAGLRGSRGKVLHNDLLLLWSSVPFLFASVDVSLRDRERRRDLGWTIRSATAIAAVIYCIAGYHKLRRSGFEWAIGDNVRYVMVWGPSVGHATWGALATWVADHAWAYKLTGAFILGFELDHAPDPASAGGSSPGTRSWRSASTWPRTCSSGSTTGRGHARS